ncbi:MAG: GGDEF domain-containing phosphodiesterase [Bacillota bacterium]
MSLGKGNDLIVSKQLFQIVSDFKNANNIQTETIGNLIQNICDIFDMDRVYAARRIDVHKNAIVPVMEYEQGGKLHYFDADVAQFTAKNSKEELDYNERRCAKMCAEKQLFSGDEIAEIREVLASVNYQQKEGTTLSEIIVYCFCTEELFSYFVFERYEGNELFAEGELFFLRTICEIVSTKIEETISEINANNQKKIKDAIINEEEMPVCLVEKETQKIVYFNDFFQKILPVVKIGMSYYDLNQKMENYKIDAPELLRLQDKYWIKKSVPLTLNDDVDAYLVYAKDAEDYIKQLEGIDMLTSTFSVKGFSDYYNKAIKGDEKTYYVCIIDIDKFKYINYSFGFSIGNQVLKNIANIIDDFLELPEAYCRVNGDKFAMILQCAEREKVIEKMNQLFDRLDEMQIELFSEIKMKFTCGVKKVETNYSINRLIDCANSAHKTVKGRLDNTVTFFDKTIAQREKEEMKIEQRITKAVEGDEFTLYLQPKFELETNSICGAEALVRWQMEDGMIVPDKFIPLFEKDGFINTLDFIMYKKVMEHIRKCLDQGVTVYPISVNVSRSHIQNKNFIHQVMDLVHEYNVPVELLELEVTESMFVEDRKMLIEFIDNIKKLGITVSIDDFGTAYSSLQVLKDVDIDILKIDKGFLDNIDSSSQRKFTKDEAVLKNIINLASDLGYKVICEGIETQEQVDLLLQVGCKYGQGYIFARPMPVAEYEKRFLEVLSEIV